MSARAPRPKVPPLQSKTFCYVKCMYAGGASGASTYIQSHERRFDAHPLLGWLPVQLPSDQSLLKIFWTLKLGIYIFVIIVISGIQICFQII